MKKNMYIMTFLMIISMLFIPKVSASITTDFGTFPDLPGMNNTGAFMIFQNRNTNDTYGIVGDNSSCNYISFNTNTLSYMWMQVEASPSSCAGVSYKLNGGNWAFNSYVSNRDSGYNNRITNLPYTDYNIATTRDFLYYSNSWTYQTLISAGSGFPPPCNRQIYLTINNTSNRPTLTNQVIATIYDTCNEWGYDEGELYYSYNGTDYYNTNITENGDTYTLDVYTNGLVYFKVVKDNVTTMSNSIEVTNLATINGYSVYVLPSGNHNIYLSNFNNDSGTIYVNPSAKVFTDSFNYLDSSGNLIGTIPINYNLIYDNWVPVVNNNNYKKTLTGYDYNFTDYVNTKIIEFNYNNDEEITIYIPNGIYIDIVDINDRNNFNCNVDQTQHPIFGAITLQNCYVEYEYQDNGTTQSGVDLSKNMQEKDESTFYSDSNSIISSSTTFLIGITTIFTTFYNSLNHNIQIAIATCFIVLILFIIYKVIKQK